MASSCGIGSGATIKTATNKVATAVTPVFFGGTILQSYDTHLQLPLLGELHLVSSTFFDIGVYLVVIGLVLGFVCWQLLSATSDSGAEAARAVVAVVQGPSPDSA